MKEEWKIINGFSKYQISNLGRIKNIKTGRILNPGKNQYGYELVCIPSDEGKKETKSVHRLVALNWIENDNPEVLTDVNHINENKCDNSVTNLEWVSHFENMLNKSKGSESRDLKKHIRVKFDRILNCASEEQLKQIYNNMVKTKTIDLNYVPF